MQLFLHLFIILHKQIPRILMQTVYNIKFGVGCRYVGDGVLNIP